jgi:hypothetical protein
MRHSLDRFYGALFSIAHPPRLRPPRISILPARGAYSRKWRELVALENIAAELEWLPVLKEHELDMRVENDEGSLYVKPVEN